MTSNKKYFILNSLPTAAMWEVVVENSPTNIRSNHLKTKYIVKSVEGHDASAKDSPLHYSPAYTEEEMLLEVQGEEWNEPQEDDV